MSEYIEQFRAAIGSAGLAPPDVIEPDGKLHRFASNGKRRDDAGWYVLHQGDIPGGAFGDWRTGKSENWKADIGRTLSPQEEAAHRARMKAVRRARDADGAKRKAEARQRAESIWRTALPATDDHPYLLKKGIKAHGLRVYETSLVIPMRDTSELNSLQLIGVDGDKRFLTGGRVSGCYFSIGPLGNALCIAEGYATSASIHEATGLAVAVAFNAGNLQSVAWTLRAQYPDLRLIVCADDDIHTAGNPGLTKAREAAQAVGGFLALPDFGKNRPDDATDFNDLHRHVGLAAVRAGIDCAQSVECSTEATGKGQPVAVTRCMKDIQPEPISWLWPGRIARGKVTLIAGDPGLGKSQLTAALAACVSVGGLWPVDRSQSPTGNVIILNAEDDAADTIRPRLDAAGANVHNVYVLDAIRTVDDEGRLAQRSFDLARDISTLASEARRIGNVTLIIIDPISAYLGGTDSHRNADIRAVMAPLASMAGALDAAIVAVSHLNKSSGSDALMRVTGSLAFVAAARAAFLVVKDAAEPARRLFVSAKNNLGPDQGNGLAFRVVPVTLDNGIATSRLEWEAEPVAITANEALSALSDDTEERSALTDVKRYLCDLLASGPMPAREVEQLAKAEGHTLATIRRAKKALELVVDKQGFQAGWRWSLPSKMLKSTEDAQAKLMSTFGNDEHLRQPAGSGAGLTEVEL